MDPIPLPAPFGGVDESIPVIALQSPACANLLNFNVTLAGVTLRHGDSKYKVLNPLYNSKRLFHYGDSKAFVIAVNNTTGGINIIDVDTNSVVYTNAAVVAPGEGNFYPLFFNNYLFFLTASSGYAPGIYYDGSTFGMIGYSGIGLGPICGNVYNHRSYLVQTGSTASYWYSEVDAISGPMRKVVLDTIVNERCSIAASAAFTLSDQVSAVVIQAFIMSTGEILFYTGSYPDSADWTIVGKGKIGSMLDFEAVVAYKNDQIVFCDDSPVSLRDLFLKGSEDATSLMNTSRITDTWTTLVQQIRTHLNVPTGPFVTSLVRGVWDQKNNRIIISFAYVPDTSASQIPQPGNFMFIYNTIVNSWHFHRSQGTDAISYGIIDLVKYKNKILLLSSNASGVDGSMVYEKEGATGFTDRNQTDNGEVGYDFDITSAPVANGRAYVQQCTGLDVILQTDMYDVTNYNLIADLGVLETSAQKLPTGPSATLQKPNVNMGIEGSYIQFEVGGTTTTGKTVGLDIFGFNFWQQLGSSPR